MMSSSSVETRNRILKASLTLLVRSEGKEVRMADIAKKAGVSRQALYLHFGTRADLLVATTHYLDDIKGSDSRLAASRAATKGIDRLDAFIEAWAGYIPEIYGVAKALLAMSDTDEAAEDAWKTRMSDMREGCAAAIEALKSDGALTSDLSVDQATDILWTMLSVRNWEQLTRECGWSQEQFVETLKLSGHRILVKTGARN